MSLSDYVQHRSDCARSVWCAEHGQYEFTNEPCDCGLDAELARQGTGTPAPDVEALDAIAALRVERDMYRRYYESAHADWEAVQRERDALRTALEEIARRDCDYGGSCNAYLADAALAAFPRKEPTP